MRRFKKGKASVDDRSLLLDDAQRPQDHDLEDSLRPDRGVGAVTIPIRFHYSVTPGLDPGSTRMAGSSLAMTGVRVVASDRKKI
jgi:hypothetical protein